MQKIENITNENHQTHTLLIDELQIEIKLHFYEAQDMWAMDISYDGTTYYNQRLTLGALILDEYRLPFAFAVSSADGSGVNPITSECFSGSRCELYIALRDEIENAR